MVTHVHRAPKATPIRTRLGRAVFTACVECNARIFFRIGHNRAGEWVATPESEAEKREAYGR